ncbi:Tetratricopeptide-like helical [Artemisia annua]|uniref:Tetratricopeptide-like helical n=1 Tax=Artemisia annua TaxID=35608 RepID=A0A2U1MFB6_ARTAN|nr:Tetratricopeptide-like helical [Artemisia annua]
MTAFGDNENIAQQIIKNRDLRGRVTTIPLNRIKSKPVQPQVKKAAVDLVAEMLKLRFCWLVMLTKLRENTYITIYISHVGGGNAEVALLLVGYADEVKIAMEFVFGDTFFKTNDAPEKNAMGRMEDAIKEMTLEKNSREIGNAYRDMAEAYVALLNFGEALPYCEKAMEIHKVQLGSNLVEVAHCRRLLGVIYTGLEQHEKALEQNQLSQKVMKNWGLTTELLRAKIDAANMQIVLGKFDEAINTLKGGVLQTDKESEDRAMIFVSMAKALCNQDKFLEAKRRLQMNGPI